jgi:outer membrane lipoprotein-sorting protein
MFFQVLLSLNLLLLTLSACAAPEPVSAKAAQATLAAAWQVDQHIVWEIAWPAAPVGGPLTVESWRMGQRYRFEVLEATAPDLVGQTLLSDGQTTWRYNRFDTEMPPAPSLPLLPPVSDAFAFINRVMAATPETAVQEAVQLRTGPAQKITLTFDSGSNLTLWRDETTGLPVQVIFQIGQQQATLRARSFEPLLDPPEALFRP